LPTQCPHDRPAYGVTPAFAAVVSIDHMIEDHMKGAFGRVANHVFHCVEAVEPARGAGREPSTRLGPWGIATTVSDRISVSACTSWLLAKPSPLAQRRICAVSMSLPGKKTWVGWGWGEPIGPSDKSTCPIPIRRHVGNAGVDCAQNASPRFSPDSAARCASCPLYVGPRCADASATFWRTP
jgi:hypothetical protein